jgi:hypothetical protein
MIFLPVLGQVFLTLVLYIALAVAKTRAIKSGQVDLDRRALHGDAWPESVLKINNNIRSQFEVPVLFYVVSIVLWLLGAAGLFAQSLAWLFLTSRVAHAYIHTGSNYIPTRLAVFKFGCLVVLLMLALAVWAVLTS